LTIQAAVLDSGGYGTPRNETKLHLQSQIRDVFISHASEDKVEIARPLAEALTKKGLTVWFDEYELTLGDRLRRKIEEGLRVSRYGVTILSENFFRKKWPQEELDASLPWRLSRKKFFRFGMGSQPPI